MDAGYSVAVYVIIDDTMGALGHRSHPLAGVSDAEVLTVAVVAARYFGNHHARALAMLQGTGYLSRRLSASRLNRRLHALADWLALLLETLGELFARGQAAIADFVIDSMPVPVCRRVRAWRCKTVRGRVYCGYCAAKKEKFFGWRLHLVCTIGGIPVAFSLLPAACHDLTPVHELTAGLPPGCLGLRRQGLQQRPRRGQHPRRHRRPPGPRPQGHHGSQLPGRAGRHPLLPRHHRDRQQPAGEHGPPAPPRTLQRRPRTQAPRLPPRSHLLQRRLAITVAYVQMCNAAGSWAASTHASASPSGAGCLPCGSSAPAGLLVNEPG